MGRADRRAETERKANRRESKKHVVRTEFTRAHAKLIVEMTELDVFFDDQEEVDLMEKHNPELLEAQRALVKYSEGK